MKKQQGFTLIELIMVIVILGILSAFALPRFADLSGNAETASLEGALGSMKSASAIIHASALANNQTGATGEVTLEGDAFALVQGYPDAGGAGSIDGTAGNGFGVLAASGISATDYTVTYDAGAASNAAATTVMITIAAPAAEAECVIYEEAAADGVPTIEKDVINAGNTACGSVTY